MVAIDDRVPFLERNGGSHADRHSEKPKIAGVPRIRNPKAQVTALFRPSTPQSTHREAPPDASRTVHDRASRTWPTGTIRRPSTGLTWADAARGTTTRSIPAARAADNRWSRPGTGRTDPVSAISPTNAVREGGATPVPADASAAARARSAPGSSSRTPPTEAP